MQHARSRPGGARRAATPGRRPAVPAVLLTAVGAAFAALALTGAASPVDLSVRALAETAAQEAPGPGGLGPVDIIYGLDLPAATTKVTPAPAATRASKAPARASRSRTRGLKWASPVNGHLTSRFGYRWGRSHKGVDIGARYGLPVRAVAPGTVQSAGWGGGYGNLVTIRHDDGTITSYAHMSRILVYGGRVAAGDQIGRVGSTGRSTGPHLHFEVRRSGEQLNPLWWLRSRGISF